MPSSFSNRSKPYNKFNDVVRLQNALEESSSDIEADVASEIDEEE